MNNNRDSRWANSTRLPSSGATIYHHPDHLSTRVSTDSSGNVARAFGHYPFGETWYESGTASKLKFTSYERDSESGNDYALLRTSEPRDRRDVIWRVAHP